MEKLYGNGNINRVGKMIRNNDTTIFSLIRWNDSVYEFYEQCVVSWIQYFLFSMYIIYGILVAKR